MVLRLVLLGGPGSGKGTQAEMLEKKFGIPHISTGDIFRSNIREETELGSQASRYMNAGLLVPDELTLHMVGDRLAGEDCRNGFVFDGFPRTVPQAEYLDKLLGKTDTRLDWVINIKVPDIEIIRRISSRRICSVCGTGFNILYKCPAANDVCDTCGGMLVQRDDDKEDTIMERLRTYHIQNSPLVEFYCNKGLLVPVDGRGSIGETSELILKELNKRICGVTA